MATDKDIQDNLRAAVDELRTAADRVQGKDDHAGRNTMLLARRASALGILFNPITGPATRRWLTDLIPGKDEFDYAAARTAADPTASARAVGAASRPRQAAQRALALPQRPTRPPSSRRRRAARA